MEKELICIVCPRGCRIKVTGEEGNFNVQDNACSRGYDYAINEMTAPKRNLCALVSVKGGSTPVVSVKTSAQIPKEKIFEVMKVINKTSVKAPIKIGDVIIEDVLGLGVDILASREC